MIIALTEKEARELCDQRRGLFGCNKIDARKYGKAYLGYADGNTYIILEKTGD